jgi:hypothetical protein
MRISRRQVWTALTVTMTVLGATRSSAQINTTLTEQDRAEIQALSTTYRRALFGCKAEEYADLFATPGVTSGAAAAAKSASGRR